MSEERGHFGTIVASLVWSSAPEAYRLARYSNGDLVLQGAYTWTDGMARGVEWRDIPTVDLER